MKISFTIVSLILLVVLCSCGKKKEIKEEKITITVERPDKSGPDVPADQQPAPPKDLRSADLLPERAKGGGIDVDTEQSRQILHEMVKNDPLIAELVKEENVFKLTQHLLDKHRDEVAKIAEGSGIDDKRIVAFQLSRHLVMRGKKKAWEQRQRGPSLPRRRREESFP